MATTYIGTMGDDNYIVTNTSDKIIEAVNGGTDSVVSTVSYTLGNNVEVLTLIGNNTIYGSGNNLDNIITGNHGNNRLNSGRGNDTVYGGDGSDTINGGDGNDVLYGDSGNDNLNGDNSDDKLYGGEGNDKLTGSKGNDILEGGAGNDVYVFNKGDGQDIIRDTEGNNQIQLGRGIKLANLELEVSDENWVITFKDNGDRLTIDAQDGTVASQFSIEGKTYSATQLQALLNPVATDEITNTMIGTQKANVFVSTSANDYMEGYLGSDVYKFGVGSGRDTIFDFTLQSDDEYSNTRNNLNSVVFTKGLTLEDLDIQVVKGYDTELIKDYPSEFSFTTQPVLDGETWTVRIKGTDDVLTILNQKPAMGAIANFSFEAVDGSIAKTYTASEVFQHMNQGLSGDEITNHNFKPVFTANKAGDELTYYGTSENDTFDLNRYHGEEFTVYSPKEKIVYGGAGNDSVILGLDSYGNVSFFGGNGNDRIEANHTDVSVDYFDGGKGDDFMSIDGNIGTYVFRKGDGHDTINNFSTGGEIHFTGGLSASDVSVSYHGTGDSNEENPLTAVVTINETGDSISMPVLNVAELASFSVNSFRFDSGSTYTLAELPQNGSWPQVDSMGSAAISEKSSSIAEGITAKVNDSALSAITEKAESTSAQDLLADNTAKDALEKGINSLTTASESNVGVAEQAAYSGSVYAANTLLAEQENTATVL